MYKERPWTLKSEETKTRKRYLKPKNALESAKFYFNSNPNKIVTAKELENILGYKKAMVSVAIKGLLETKEIKIVGFTECRTLTPLYQSIKGKKRVIKLIDLFKDNGTYCSLAMFIEKHNVPSPSYFRTLVGQSNLSSFYAKNPYSVVYYYKDLVDLLKKYYKNEKGKWNFSFKIFGLEIIIKTLD